MSNLPKIGATAPDFAAKDHKGDLISLSHFAAHWLVLYFYPKDNTPGCTTEAIDFTHFSPEFAALNAKVVGVSPDTEKSHGKFIEKHNLSLQLLSDPEHTVTSAYGVWGLKKFMGKEYMGVIRSTFLIDADGKVAYVWPNVRVKGHAEAVLKKLRELGQS
ncbi:thioredoxin-dependent thiol peroxidase [Gloeothece verrucosa]|uniref:thioredoxin-dependent peroxiredoxin n=1 Tax=Gloeothece verrucosa (strain PCC 7822) TaxID=497965 RepID=E0UGN3_GLOV7|nr:thioredoxin-dependent thiol peroxidase [Gloeothece verrucosa]ADN13242.1 Peroxiredoxin [Gloeothece verrucosa PCC 7822]